MLLLLIGTDDPLMNPQLSSPRRSFLRKVAISSTVLAGATGAATARRGDASTASDGIAFEEGLTYASREAGENQTAGDLKLDLHYHPDSNEPTPLVVYIHGGGWIAGSRKDTPDLQEYFAKRGYAMATIDHRYSYVPEDGSSTFPPNRIHPKGKFPDHIVDVKAAIRWLRAHATEYNIDPDNVATWGSSSGAHLAALAGVVDDVEEVEGDIYDIDPTVAPEKSGAVQAAVPWYPPTDLLKMDEQASNDSGAEGLFPHNAPTSPESLLIGEQITKAPDKVARANPLTYVDSDASPMLLMHGRQDRLVPYEQSTILYEALRDACVDASFHELHSLGHGFGFEELTQKPVIDQTVYETKKCKSAPGNGSPPKDHTSQGPPPGPKVIEQFLDRHLSQ